MKLRFMTYNIQHGINYHRQKELERRGGIWQEPVDLALMAEEIRRQKADIVGLNEIFGGGPSPEYTGQAEQLAAMLGCHCYFASALRLGGNPYGNAILSRFPILEAKTIGIPDPPVRDEDAYYETRCVLRARFAEGFTVLISHFGLAKAEARNAVETVLSLLREEKGPVVLMGDFNLEPDSPILAPLFEELTDTAALFPCPLKSWPSDEPEQKIDYIFVKNAQALEADIPPVEASDHRPHTALIEL
ncbi:endonuclease/exonuclease/phosphatase family protein [Neglectibacter caecimuris]|uniref:endonuclease/exonuclease/phosphatase family protein n=1 Tax=Neglectibacter caecimuris TaxID=3093658 RepID=UPI002AC8ADE1|nr:endonuclease/exonuclease/phosphatase family protein [Neglectibacter sp. M00184]